MEKTLGSTIEKFGGRVASVWRNLHPSTRGLMERALVSTGSTPAVAATRHNIPYTARAEQELSRLLAALDDRAAETGGGLTLKQKTQLDHMAETCAAVLELEAQSAEVFAQLLERAVKLRDYKRVDTLADAILARLPPSEMCELARHAFVPVRAIAMEALAQSPTPMLAELLNDPVDADIARLALKTQANEYGSEEARWIMCTLDELSINDEDF